MLLSHISEKLASTLPAIMIGNIITSIINNQATSLQVALGILVRKTSLVDKLSQYGVTCNYDETLRFKASAAAATDTDNSMRGITDSSVGLVQAVADNFDANISSQNGLKSTHALALLITQVQPDPTNEDSESDCKIKRLKKVEMKNEIPPDIPVQVYAGPKKPDMPELEAKRSVLPLKVLAQREVALRRANILDLEFLKRVVSEPATPEFGGFNTQLTREQNITVKPGTKAMYQPLIDMTPSDPTTMMTAMVEAQKLTNQTGQTFTVFTADQQLYRVMVDVLWVYPEIFPNFIPRLGGMHTIMSFVGCVGTLMAESGLEEVLKAAFGGVPRMLTGKNFPQNVRALRLVTEEVLRGIIESVDSHTDLMPLLESKAIRSRTAKLWLDNLIKPVFIMMLFIRAEREGDWSLHICAVTAMMPYFFAAGHANYARYGLYYLRSMERLPDEVLARFLKGEHVMRHKPGLWNGIWSDMYIETTFMRYGHGPGGLIGITLNQSALKRWALSLHICSRLIRDVSEMEDGSTESHEVTMHKEEMPARKKSDAVDRENIRAKLETCIDPLDTDDHPSGIVNIISGRIGPDKVNVDEAVAVGRNQMLEYESTWPEGFHSTLSKKVMTMNVNKKQVQLGDASIFDTEVIFSRVMGLMASRAVDVKDIFRYELSPIPTSMFEDNGDMRVTKAKSVLKRKLQVEQSARTVHKTEVVIIDGCAILWIINWPTRGTVQDFVDGFLQYILSKLKQSKVYLVFDRYYEYSIKSNTRSFRAGQKVRKRHKLSPSTPLPPQQVVLNVSENKIQIIDIICQQLLQRVQHIQTTGTTSCHSLVVTGSNTTPQEVSLGVLIQRGDLTTSHEEADVVMVQQAVALANQGINCMKVICDDTDVFVLLVHYYHHCKLTCQLLMEGTSSKRTVIDIGATAKQHVDIVPDILAAHVLSGCDTVPHLWGIGKSTVIKVLKKGCTLESLGNPNGDIEDITAAATVFAAKCYGSSVQGTMSDVRFDMWKKTTAKKKLTAKPKLKALPPTTEAFKENVKRAHIQACVWNSVLSEDPPDMDPCNFGWSKDEPTKSLVPVSVPDDVEPAPPEILQVIRCGCSTDQPCSTGRCKCTRAQLTCTFFCSCNAENVCYNQWTKRATEESDQDSEEEAEE